MASCNILKDYYIDTLLDMFIFSQMDDAKKASSVEKDVEKGSCP